MPLLEDAAACGAGLRLVVSVLLEFMGTGYNNPSSTEINYDIIILTYLRFLYFLLRADLRCFAASFLASITHDGRGFFDLRRKWVGRRKKRRKWVGRGAIASNH